MTEAIRQFAEYFQALDRLKSGRSVRMPKGTKITKDAVSLEAGRGKGSIKKSRPEFLSLIQAISAAASEQVRNTSESLHQARFEKAKSAAKQYRDDFDGATSSLLSRIYEVYELKKKVRELESEVQDLNEKLAGASKKNVMRLKTK